MNRSMAGNITNISRVFGGETRHLMLLTVKSAVAEDEHAVVALWRECDLVAPYNDPVADFRFAKAGPSSDVLVAVDDTGELAASVMVGHDGHRGWLYYVATRPASRGKGVGRQLMQAAENWLRHRGIVKAQLLVRETNTGVVGFYQRLGFEVAPRVVMSKWLEKIP
jgi:ribosomal protein S18 acetylase RimI-like enzyme